MKELNRLFNHIVRRVNIGLRKIPFGLICSFPAPPLPAVIFLVNARCATLCSIKVIFVEMS